VEKMEFLFAADRERYRRMTTSELREAYMVDGMFIPGDVTLCYTDIDRAIVGSAVPLEDSLTLPVHKELASDFFAQRREIGVINIGGSGKVTVDGETYDMENRDSLYIGRGSKDVEFRSNSKDSPAQSCAVLHSQLSRACQVSDKAGEAIGSQTHGSWFDGRVQRTHHSPVDSTGHRRHLPDCHGLHAARTGQHLEYDAATYSPPPH
jgi:5-keto 4-deoxyuronate isomerase